jgi:predicted phosphodiesterase
VVNIKPELISINPGSLSYPRQEGRRPSFVIMEIDKNSEAHFTVNYL